MLKCICPADLTEEEEAANQAHIRVKKQLLLLLL
jgi:hypothetical protein